MAGGGRRRCSPSTPTCRRAPLRAELPWPFPGAQPIAGGGGGQQRARDRGARGRRGPRGAAGGRAVGERRAAGERPRAGRARAPTARSRACSTSARRARCWPAAATSCGRTSTSRAQWDAWDVDATYAGGGRRAAGDRAARGGRARPAPRRRPLRAALPRQPHRPGRAPVGGLRADRLRAPGWTGTTAAGWSRRASRSPCAPQRATFETAFGVVERPTHRNTSWDEAPLRGRRPPLRRPLRARLRRRAAQRRALRPPRARLRARPEPAALADVARSAGRRGRAGGRLRAASRTRGAGWRAACSPRRRTSTGRCSCAPRERAAPARALRPLALDGLPLGARRAQAARGRRRAGAARLRAAGRAAGLRGRCHHGWALDAQLDLLERPSRRAGPSSARSRCGPGRCGLPRDRQLDLCALASTVPATGPA